MRLNARHSLQFFLLLLSVSCLPACLSSGVRSSGSPLPQAGTSFGDGQLKVEIDHNCGARCESVSAKFENLTATPIEILVNQARLKRGAEKFVLKRQGKERGNVVVPAKSSVSAEFAPFSSANGRRLSYVVPESVWCSVKIDPACRKTLEADAQCAGYARGYFTVYNEAEGWVVLNFTYKIGERTEVVESPAPDSSNLRGPSEVPKADDRAPAFFREPNNIVFYKMECNDKCKCKNLTKPRSNSEDGLKPVIEPIP
ncbi:MAG: hypothetical protein RL189_2265 [Pseudomonadota bacterium]|jgi:hypothetical protein